MAINASVLEMP